MAEQPSNRILYRVRKPVDPRLLSPGLPVPGDSTDMLWAILMNEGGRYLLKEYALSCNEAASLVNGKYRGRDVILTLSTPDIDVRVTDLNRSVPA